MFSSYKNSVFPEKVIIESSTSKNNKKKSLLNGSITSMGLEKILYESRSSLSETELIVSKVDWKKPVLIVDSDMLSSTYQLDAFTISPVLAILRSKNNQAISLIPQKELKRFVQESNSELFMPNLLGACLVARNNKEMAKKLIQGLYEKYISDFYDELGSEFKSSGVEKSDKLSNLLGNKLAKEFLSVMVALPPTTGVELFSIFENQLLNPFKKGSPVFIEYLLPKFNQFKMPDSFFESLLKKYWLPNLEEKKYSIATIKNIVNFGCFNGFETQDFKLFNESITFDFIRCMKESLDSNSNKTVSESFINFSSILLSISNKHKRQNNDSIALGVLTHNLSYLKDLKKRWGSAHATGFSYALGETLYELFKVHKIKESHVSDIVEIVSLFEKTLTGDYEKNWFVDGYMNGFRKDLVSVKSGSQKREAQIEYNYNVYKKRIKVFSIATTIPYRETINIFHERRKVKNLSFSSILDRLKLEKDEEMINESLTVNAKNIKTAPRF